jgi:2-polyprenyl-3-methyl-5-hydroxy-6-metoxy-1,4-benzoquinol methylase
VSSFGVEKNKLDEISTAEASRLDLKTTRKPFGPPWPASYWGKWQTITFALNELGIPEGANVLDVGTGVGWTTVFLGEAGFRATGVDIAPANIEIAKERARRTGVHADFAVADMDTMDLDRQFDAVLVFDALHHSTRPAAVVERISKHLPPGGWVLFGEPSWLHGISPRARRTSRELGWVERGVVIRQLKRHCTANGLGNFRRFYEGTEPYASPMAFVWQLARLVGARFACAPQMSIWLAAQRL